MERLGPALVGGAHPRHILMGSSHFSGQKIRGRRKPPSYFWCTIAIQIRTGIIFFNCSFYIVERDGFRTVLVVESDDHFVIVQIDSIDEDIDKPLPVILSVDVQLTELMQPEGDKLCADPGLCDLLVGNLNFQIFLGAFQFFQAALGGFREDAHLDCVQDVLDAVFYFPKLRFQNRQGSVFSVLQVHDL